MAVGWHNPWVSLAEQEDLSPAARTFKFFRAKFRRHDIMMMARTVPHNGHDDCTVSLG